MTGGPATAPIRIAFVRQRYTPGGGAERIIERAIERLRTHRDVHVTILARRWPDQPGLQGIRLDPPYLGRTWRDLAFDAAVSRCMRRERFDIVQSHERVAGATVFRAGDGVHAGWLERWLPTLPAWRRALVRMSPYHRATLSRERRMFEDPRLRAVIANSDFVARDVARHFPDVTSRIRVIRNGVDCGRFHPGLGSEHRAAVRRTLGIEQGARVMLFLGSGFERKGLRTALRTLASLSGDVHLLVVGRDRNTSRFQSLAKALGVADRTHWMGTVQDPRPCLGASDIAILPSLYDPMPNSVLEAMACGLPVIASSFTGAVDLIRPLENGVLAHPTDQDAWDRGTAELLTRDRLQARSQAARATVEPWTLERMVDGWVGLYEELLATRG